MKSRSLLRYVVHLRLSWLPDIHLQPPEGENHWGSDHVTEVTSE
jgi:hypothetical protein